MNSQEEIAELVRACTDCPLSQGRTHAVPGEGASNSRVIFIGEAPGYQEDQQGRPFVGPAGRLLDDLLQTVGLNREDIFIANMIKCRPPGNRDPLPSEVAACTKYLDRQIELLKPDLIVTLGRYAMGKYFPNESITRVRGKVRVKDGQRILPLLHPAAALHQQSLKESIQQDFLTIPDALEGPGQTTTSQLEPDPPTPSARQLSMF